MHQSMILLEQMAMLRARRRKSVGIEELLLTNEQIRKSSMAVKKGHSSSSQLDEAGASSSSTGTGGGGGSVSAAAGLGTQLLKRTSSLHKRQVEVGCSGIKHYNMPVKAYISNK